MAAGAVSKEALISHLHGLGITPSLHEHPVVMTTEEMITCLGHLEITPSKNLFLKDKKGRLYLVSALATTIVDLKALSVRLGLGKGGLRMASEDSLQDVLKVKLGSVTPLALINPSARKPIYVDFEAAITVGKDQPPDLAGYITESIIEPVPLEDKQANCVSSNVLFIQAGEANGTMPSSKSKVLKTERHDEGDALQELVGDPRRLLDYVLQRTISAALSKVRLECGNEEIDHSMVNNIKNEIGPDLESKLILFKNTAYTQGFLAAVHSGRSR